MIDKAFLKEFLLKPLCYAGVFLLAVYILNTFTNFNFSLSSNSNNNSFEVTGTGKVTAVPNVAQTNFSVTEKGKTQEEAKNSANAKLNSAIEVLISLGVKKEHIKTDSFYVNPNYEDVVAQPLAVGTGTSSQFIPAQRTSNGFVANVSTTVKSEKVEVLNQAIDKLTALGINVGGVTYSFDDQESYKAQARVKAIEDARKKADELAKVAGFKVGKLISIMETDQGGIYPYANAMKATAPETRDTTTDLQPGENEISTSVTITYGIKN